ncbi:MAG: nucleotide exchange factor GrpE [Bacteroidales bacterium]|nr:nucleotide exchange factor GrpE [Bacteroidales bacterium]
MEKEKDIKEEQKTQETGQKPVQEQKADKKKSKKDDGLQKKVDELTDKLAKEKEDYMRLMAEFETFRRRSAEERLNLVNSAAADTIKGFIPVLDDLDAAMKVLANSDDKSSLEGIQLIYNKLIEYLKSCGLEMIDAEGKPFDTDFHEALTQVPAPTEELKGKVIEVFKPGYTFKGKVIRYAKVVVGM